MSKNKTNINSNRYFVWIFVGLGLILAIVLWVWPTYLAPRPDITQAVMSISQLQANQIDVEQAYQKREQGTLMLDVRTQEEWDAGHIPGATLIPLDQIAIRFGELPVDQEIVIYCRSGNRSAQALSILNEEGFSDIYSMDGGINDWILAGYEVTEGD